MLKTALLTLTMTASGDPRLTLSDMESAADCQAARARVVEILTQSGVEVIAAMCGDTPLQLTPFEHGAAPEEEIHLYEVEIRGAGFSVQPVAAGQSCGTAPPGTQLFCARSSQWVLGSASTSIVEAEG